MGQDMTSYDVAIVGGGLSGLSQSLLLAQEGFRVLCVDREAPASQLTKGYDTRTTAISWGSRNVLWRAGVWQEMEERSCPIRDIKILDGDSPFALSFLSQEVEGREFGWIVNNHDLRCVLHERAAGQENLDHITGDAVTMFHVKQDGVKIETSKGQSYDAQLVLGCDGRKSFTREFMGIGTWGRDYEQTAIVCIVDHEHPHEFTAVEHFLPEGPFASLPMLDDNGGQTRSAVVWSIHGGDASQFLKCDEETFNAHLEGLYKGRFGKVSLSGARAGWPLNIVMAYEYTRPRMAIMAEAAHGIHPIAGQGLNISLRDCAAMTEILVKARANGVADCGSAQILRDYQKSRRMDNTMMGLAMEGFNGLFSNDRPLLKFARKTGLRLINRLPKAKRFFMTQAMGTVGHVPEMVKSGYGEKR
jgi:2-octaprenyl-6-methoxyphenol hydroxylase